MDGQRFDNFARLISSGASRRLVLKLLGGSVAGGFASLVGQRQRAAGAGNCEFNGDCADGELCCLDNCAAVQCCSDNDCSSGTCCNGSCREVQCCVEDGDPNPRCGPGETCDGGACYTPNCGSDFDCEGICCSGSCLSLECCAGDGESDPRCPSGYVCSGGACRESNICQSDGDCAVGHCCSGTCYDVECCGYGDDARCQAGYYCDETVCVKKPGCSSDNDCDGICCGGACVETECCADDPDTSNHCGALLYCSNGACVEPTCSNDDHCPGGQICCDHYCYAIECCAVDPDPDARCTSGYVCRSDTCVATGCTKDADCDKGICCSGTCTAGVAQDECCIDDANPNARCPQGTTCFEGICDSDEDDDETAEATATQPAAQATATARATPVLDKWALWTGDVKLAGATLYLRRLTAEDDPAVMGDDVVGPDYQQADFDRLAKLGANYVELCHPAPYGETAPYDLDASVRDYLEHLTRHGQKSDLFSVISYRTGPGRSEAIPRGYPICEAGGCFSGGPAEGNTPSVESRLWKEKEAQDAWVDLWQSTAERFKDNPLVIGYHLMAMPDAPDLETYRAFLERLAAAIRAVDPATPLLVSAPHAGLPKDLDGFSPLDDDYTIYRVQTFAPLRYLRQPSDADDPLTYGEAFDPEEDQAEGDFNRDWLVESLKPAKTWAKSNKRPVAIGAYGFPRWQPGLESYLDDLLDLIEDADWRATLWLWQPAKGPGPDDAFNLEHGPDPATHRLRDNPLTDILAKHWRDVDVRPSRF